CLPHFRASPIFRRSWCEGRSSNKGKSMQKYVYFCGGGKAEGNGDMKDTLGGKGAGLAEMTNASLPVPPGFTISTDVCRGFYENNGKLADDIQTQINDALGRLESLTEHKL